MCRCKLNLGTTIAIWLACLIPMIVLFSLAPRQAQISNTRGKIVTGGNCTFECDILSYCTGTGMINVTFYLPNDGLTSIEQTWQLTGVPDLCLFNYQTLTVESLICCDTYIVEQTPLYIKAELEKEQWTIQHISQHRVDNSGAYLIISSLLIAPTGVLTCLVVAQLYHLVRRCKYVNVEQQLPTPDNEKSYPRDIDL